MEDTGNWILGAIGMIMHRRDVLGVLELCFGSAFRRFLARFFGLFRTGMRGFARLVIDCMYSDRLLSMWRLQRPSGGIVDDVGLVMYVASKPRYGPLYEIGNTLCI